LWNWPVECRWRDERLDGHVVARLHRTQQLVEVRLRLVRDLPRLQDLGGPVLGRLHVRLVEGVDAQDVPGHRRGELEYEHGPSQLRLSDRIHPGSGARPGEVPKRHEEPVGL
jgi:hypothetical protein